MKRVVSLVAVSLLMCVAAFSQDKPQAIGGGWMHSVTTDAMTDERRSIFSVDSADKTSTVGFSCTNTNHVTKLMVTLPDSIKPIRKGKASVMVRETHSLEPQTITVDAAPSGKMLLLPPEYVAYFLTTQRLVIRYTNTAGRVRTFEFVNASSPLSLVKRECTNKEFLSFLDDMEKVAKGDGQ